MPARAVLPLLVAALLAAGEAEAPPPAGPAFSLEAIKAAAAPHRTVRQAFVQERRLALLDQVLTTPGVIEIDRTRKAVRWEFTKQAVLILSEGRLRRFDAEGHEEVAGGRAAASRSFAGQMEALLTGDWSTLEGAFAIALAAERRALVLTPKGDDLKAFITRVEVVLRPDLIAPERIVLIAAGGDATDYRFAPPDLDIEIPAARFAGY